MSFTNIELTAYKVNEVTSHNSDTRLYLEDVNIIQIDNSKCTDWFKHFNLQDIIWDIQNDNEITDILEYFNFNLKELIGAIDFNYSDFDIDIIADYFIQDMDAQEKSDFVVKFLDNVIIHNNTDKDDEQAIISALKKYVDSLESEDL